ncbi:hypothetical protein PMAYCL1PPCAC_02072 [Pristionchus mayeri]|uniref:G domain-containing protein n=1 Tax=Pristionchus mayeri TaxID=1317129 RepID=A0AAN5C6L9_9BILA|nr:hypothetical protein PMAYCL1PPCAC_02072 [Pristionchus mayeri]
MWSTVRCVGKRIMERSIDGSTKYMRPLSTSSVHSSMEGPSNDLPSSSTPPFRESFELPSSFDFRVWFPMHMSVQLKAMEGKLRSVDLIIEVHDARIPISGRNPLLARQFSAARPHILVMNKMDLIDMNKYRRPIEEYYADNGDPKIVWTDCKRRLSKAIVDLRGCMIEALRSEPRFNRTVKTEYQVMVIGIPNVGKSSLINSLRSTNLGIKKSAVTEGARPGVTVRVQNRVRILDRPPIYILDTPGVLPPRHKSVDEAMKLALCDLVLESATEPRIVADYLLYWMNRTGDFSYTHLLGLPREPVDNIDVLLKKVCAIHELRVKRFIPGEGYQERWDMDKAVRMFIALFRGDKLRDHCLDKELLLPYL